MASNRSHETFEQQIMDQTSNTQAYWTATPPEPTEMHRNTLTEAASVRLVGYSFEPTVVLKLTKGESARTQAYE